MKIEEYEKAKKLVDERENLIRYKKTLKTANDVDFVARDSWGNITGSFKIEDKEILEMVDRYLEERINKVTNEFWEL